jgi:hypothetical protein
MRYAPVSPRIVAGIHKNGHTSAKPAAANIARPKRTSRGSGFWTTSPPQRRQEIIAASSLASSVAGAAELDLSLPPKALLKNPDSQLEDSEPVPLYDRYNVHVTIHS